MSLEHFGWKSPPVKKSQKTKFLSILRKKGNSDMVVFISFGQNYWGNENSQVLIIRQYWGVALLFEDHVSPFFMKTKIL